MRYYLICHGFAFDRTYWRNFLPYLAQEQSHVLDLGYFGNKQDLIYDSIPKNAEIIGIGHSLGILKLLQLPVDYAYLISLNGFCNFLGEGDLQRRRQKELDFLRRNFIKDKGDALHRFYVNCDIDFACFDKEQDIVLDILLQDLDFLQKEFIWPEVKTLALAQSQDKIVPLALVQQNFAPYPQIKLQIIDDLGHNLAYKYPALIWQNIKKFLDDSANR